MHNTAEHTCMLLLFLACLATHHFLSLPRFLLFCYHPVWIAQTCPPQTFHSCSHSLTLSVYSKLQDGPGIAASQGVLVHALLAMPALLEVCLLTCQTSCCAAETFCKALTVVTGMLCQRYMAHSIWPELSLICHKIIEKQATCGSQIRWCAGRSTEVASQCCTRSS